MNPFPLTLGHRAAPEMDEAFVERHVAHLNRQRRETQPGDPPLRAAELLAQLSHLPPEVDLRVWSAEAGSQVVAHATAQLLNMATNRHLAELDLYVEPEWRGRGVGRALLGEAAQLALDTGRTLLMVTTTDRVPAGVPFAELLGFTRGLEHRTNQLRLCELPAGLLDAWTTRPEDGYTLEIWHGDIAEAELEAYAALSTVMNSAPRGDLEVEDFHLTAEMLRGMQAMRRHSGRDALTAVVRDAGGTLVGLNELAWRVGNPQIVSQGGTGVRPEHRSHGLGRWLKAANVARLLEVNPQAEVIRTGNANSNAPMLSINSQMGFKPYVSSTVWQAKSADVLERLQRT